MENILIFLIHDIAKKRGKEFVNLMKDYKKFAKKLNSLLKNLDNEQQEAFISFLARSIHNSQAEYDSIGCYSRERD